MAHLTTVDPHQLAKAVVALQTLKRNEVPWYEQGMITDEMLKEIAVDVLEQPDKMAAFHVLQVLKKKDVPGWAQGFVTDELLHHLVSTVFESVGRK